MPSVTQRPVQEVGRVRIQIDPCQLCIVYTFVTLGNCLFLIMFSLYLCNQMSWTLFKL